MSIYRLTGSRELSLGPKYKQKLQKCPFPQSLRFCHYWLASGGVPGVRYAVKLSGKFYLHWERFWLGVGWSFRHNIFPGCYPEKTSKIGRAVDIVCSHQLVLLRTISWWTYLKNREGQVWHQYFGGRKVLNKKSCVCLEYRQL